MVLLLDLRFLTMTRTGTSYHYPQENCGAQVGSTGLSPNWHAFFSLVITFL